MPLCVDTLLLADIIVMWKILNHIGFVVGVNLFCLLLLLADVIAMYMVIDVKTTEADVIAYYISFYWLMILPVYLWQML